MPVEYSTLTLGEHMGIITIDEISITWILVMGHLLYTNHIDNFHRIYRS